MVDFEGFIRNEVRVAVGAAVRVFWGYGLGFRATAIGRISKVSAKSVQVKLVSDVPEGWDVGQTLYGIPRLYRDDWNADNRVQVLDVEAE